MSESQNSSGISIKEYTHLLSIIGRKFGDKELHDALYETVAGYTKRLAGAYEGKNRKERIMMLCAGLRSHCFFQNIVPLRSDEDALFTTEPAEKIGKEPCKITVQK